jgi:hypothetical protein
LKGPCRSGSCHDELCAVLWEGSGRLPAVRRHVRLTEAGRKGNLPAEPSSQRPFLFSATLCHVLIFFCCFWSGGGGGGGGGG